MSNIQEKPIVRLRCVMSAVLLPVFIVGCSTTEHLVDMSYIRHYHREPLNIPDPSLGGPLSYQTYFYGSGTDKHRKEYGPEADYKTDAVNAEAFMDPFGKLKHYWRFDRENLPLNGRVWFPNGDGPFPLVLIVHGNHKMKDFSDPGYGYLGELLASRGFVAVSVDENFLNQHFTGETDARAIILLEHLKLWRKWDRTKGHTFEGKIDMDRIALIGHSRGGETVAHAAAFNQLERYPDGANIRFDYNFNIKSIIAIAPCDGLYKPAGHSTTLENVNYLVIQGGHDADVGMFVGIQQFNRVYFTDNRFLFKSAIYVYRANHNQFNTVWDGPDGVGPLRRWLINDKPTMDADKQRQVAKVLISAFLETTLHNEKEYLPIFRDVRNAGTWLPEDIYINQYQDSNFKVIANFEENFNVSTATIANGQLLGDNLITWKESRIPHRVGGDYTQENSAVVLGWDNEEVGGAKPAQVGSYTITLCPQAVEILELNRDVNLSLSVASEDLYLGEPLDLTIELINSKGFSSQVPLSTVGPIHPGLTQRLITWKWLERKIFGKDPAERILQTYEIPISLFTEENSSFEPSILCTIRLLFDHCKKGAIILDNVGVSR